MRRILNTLYVTTPNAYLSLDGENVVVLKEKETMGRIPLHNIQAIVSFGYIGASPALIGKCIKYGIEVSFLSMRGEFICRVVGEINGNVLLRKQQYRISDNEEKSLYIAKSFVMGKIFNSRWVIERAIRDHSFSIDKDKLKNVSIFLNNSLKKISNCQNADELRGIEGESASLYFGIFDDMILQQKNNFEFKGRNKRPPLDAVNALLSYMYTILAHEAAWALSSVGLDPYVGFLHRDRPGRLSLGLDLMEEFRSILADRFVLSLINKREVKIEDFSQKENGAVIFSDDARKKILSLWQSKKQEEITHPFTKEKMSWGIVIFVQAQLLSRYIRGDLDAYPPMMWK